MNLSEFKAWFEGFTESMKSAPSEKQWARIKARVSEIDGTEITKHVYVDRYWPYPHHYWSSPFYSGSISGVGVSTNEPTWNSGLAMGALGKADYELTA
jgi:hypothetical protein